MSRPWMPLYVGDFIADTAHLSATETGIYIRLIMHCWQHGCLPRDDRKLALIGHADARLWHQYRETVLKFFDIVDASTMHHKRVTSELRRSEEISNKRKVAAEQKQNKSSANAEQLQTHACARQSQSHKKDAADAAPDPEVELFRRGREVLGKQAGGLITKLLTAKNKNIALTRAAIEQASTKSEPREYVAAIIRGKNQEDQPQWLDGIPGVI